MAADEWRNCVEWLVRCQILPADHKATKRDATAFDLAQALRDGVLICHLLNTLQPGCIDMKDFSSRPQMSQFLCMKNIRTFLQTCTVAFRLDERDLFKPNDLFDVKDFRKVLETLSKLSKTDLAQSKFKGFQNISASNGRKSNAKVNYYNDQEVNCAAAMAIGFPPESGAGNQNAELEEDIYGNLQDLAVENDLEDQEDIYDTVYQEDEEKIYDDLLRIDRFSWPASGAEPLSKRDYCIKELLDTESNYKSALEMIVMNFIQPLQNVLSHSDLELIFAFIPELFEVHKELYEKLHHSVTQNQPRLGDIFVQAKSKMLIYGDFCSNLPKAQERIDRVCEVDTVRLKIQDCESRANKGKFRLRDLLHVPMQRVLKYHLLMRELIKNTDKASSEREGLEKALEAMQDLSLYVNEVKRDHEGLQVIEEIQSSINDLRMPPNTALKDYGRFQKDGELKVLSHTDNRQRNRHIFLFDKVMLMCKAKGDTYSFKDAIVLGEFRIDEGGAGPEKKGDKWNFPFIMSRHDRSTAFTFFAKTGEQRDKWKEAVMLALDNSNPAGGRSFVMHTFDTPQECTVCGKLLRGVFFQGYLCAETKNAVHKECIGKSFATNPTAPARPPRTSTTTSLSPNTLLKGETKQAYRGTPPPPSSFRPALHFNKGDVIQIIKKDDANWWLGRFQGEEGHFPSSYVIERSSIQRKDSYVASTVLSSRSSVPNGRHPMTQEERQATPSRSPSTRSTGVPNLSSFPWYVGEMERPTAQQVLDRLPDGSFLIRVTNNPCRQGELSLSIKHAMAVRHIKVNRNSEGKFYLADPRFFSSVQELVAFYQKTELSDSFPEVNTTLKHPYKTVAAGNNQVLGYAIAIYDYAATSTSQVTLQVNDRIAVLSKTGQDRGWWKGKNQRNNRVGYFPLAYVQDEEE